MARLHGKFRTTPAAAAAAILAIAACPFGAALSHSNMHRPPGSRIALTSPVFETEEHIIFGPQATAKPIGSGGKNEEQGWSVGVSGGGSWHVWSYETLFDRIDLPLWPEAMKEARIVLSTDMCRHDSTSPLPAAPFMPAPGLEYCGIHVSATSRPDVPVARAHHDMRRWMSSFMGWSPQGKKEETASGDAGDSDGSALGPESFIDLGRTSIYYFHPFDARALSTHRGRAGKLDLVRFAVDPGHHLRRLIDPHVNRNGGSWLDQRRIEVRLSRTPHGFVKINAQVLSVIAPAEDISVLPMENATSSISWVSAASSSRSFTLRRGQERPDLIVVPDEFYTQQQKFLGTEGDVTEKTRDLGSFHPSLEISGQVEHHSAQGPGKALLQAKCHLDTIQVLPSTYFFDPYQIHDVREQLGGPYEHYGPVELEKPAEAMQNWGSILRISAPSAGLGRQAFNATIPIHARYRLPPVRERTVGYNGEPTEDTHVETVLLPAISAIVCPTTSAEPSFALFSPARGSVLEKLAVRPALFEELGVAPVAALRAAPESDMLLRMAVGSTQNLAVIQSLTLVALFAGTVYIFLATKRATSNPPKR
ncbi:hypothetical protein GQ54DRAFT_303410 [Martensiomyces pterosporus]|nr:hypothetical protein GQ54DRAFT_303410 [Martensiomyces pterosporus]